MGRLKNSKIADFAESIFKVIKTNRWSFFLAGEIILAVSVAIFVSAIATQKSEAAPVQETAPVYVKHAQITPLTVSDNVSIYSFSAEVINASPTAFETEPSIIFARDYSFDSMDLWLYPSTITDEIIMTDASVGFQIAYGNNDMKFGHIKDVDKKDLYACKFMTTGDVIDGVGIDPVTGVASESMAYNKDMYSFRDIINFKLAVKLTS